MVKEHEEVTRKSFEMEMSDVKSDRIAMWGLRWAKHHKFSVKAHLDLFA